MIASILIQRLREEALISKNHRVHDLICYLEEMSMAKDKTRPSFSSFTTCGYFLTFDPVTDETSNDPLHYLAFFVYMRLKVAVQIPSNVCCLHTFAALFGHHLTSVPIAFNSSQVFFNHKNLNVFAWGSGKSDTRTYIEARGYQVPGPRITHRDITDFFERYATPEEREEMTERNFYPPGNA